MPLRQHQPAAKPANASCIHLLEGPSGSGKTARLIATAQDYLQQYPQEGLLVLCSNHARQQLFIQALLRRLHRPLGQLPVYTFAGWVRNTLFHFWPLVETRLQRSNRTPGSDAPELLPSIVPVLSGMEASEAILSALLGQLKQRLPEAFQEVPADDRGLINQLLRRIRLRAENALTRDTMQGRSRWLNLPAQTPTTWMEQQFDCWSYQLRCLDASKQVEIFLWLMREEPTVQQWLYQHSQRLLVEDVDETTAAQQTFVNWLLQTHPTLKAACLSADPQGGSRRGYLNANPTGWQTLKETTPGTVQHLERNDLVAQAAQQLYENWMRPAVPPSPLPAACVSLSIDCLTRVEMIEHVVSDVGQWLTNGLTPGEIAIVVPRADRLSLWPLLSRLQERGIPIQCLSGTKRPVDNPVCRAFLTLLHWVNGSLFQSFPSAVEFRSILTHLLRLQQLDMTLVETLVTAYQQTHYPPPPQPQHPPVTTEEREDGVRTALDPLGLAAFWQRFEEGQGLEQEENPPFNAPFNASLAEAWQEGLARCQRLQQWFLTAQTLPFEKQLYSAFQTVVSPFATETEDFKDLGQLIASYTQQKQLFSGLFPLEMEQPGWFEARWLRQAKSGAVADTPEVADLPDPTALLIGTPQKLIDVEARRPLYLWLDTTSREWCRSDDAPLYHAWVHSAEWDDAVSENACAEEILTESLQDHRLRLRAAHLSRTLMLQATQHVRAYRCELDDEGQPQSGLLAQQLCVSAPDLQTPIVPEARATLRPDQQPILEYQAGSMAVTAVPGAGKTFVNVELILTLIARGVPAEQILVLTYMDSAAKTLLRRLQQKLGGHTQRLPTVCTIHSLAMRLLTEGDRLARLGYDPESFQLIEDTERELILRDVARRTLSSVASQAGGGGGLSDEQWLCAIDRGIAQAKGLGLSLEVLQQAVATQRRVSPRLQEFLPAYQAYEASLAERGALDFTDLILRAVRLLETHPDVAQQVRQQFAYILEDEAQDSSRLLQRLIGAIGGPNPNLIRTGDTNQSITTTFSAAEPVVFRQFIANAQRTVEMTASGRCCAPVIALANDWLHQAANGPPALKDAFAPTTMVPVVGQNPAPLWLPQAHCLQTDQLETDWLVQTIRWVRQQAPTATVAVLLRTNREVSQLTHRLQQEAIPAISLSDALPQTAVFEVLLAMLQALAYPSAGEHRLALYQALLKAEVWQHTAERQAWLCGYLQETPLFHQRVAGLPADDSLLQLYYDWHDFSREAFGSDMVGLLIRLTDRLFHTVSQRSNGYLVALQAQEILSRYGRIGQTGQTSGDHPVASLSPIEIVIEGLLQAKRNRNGRRAFTEEMTPDGGSAMHRFVQVMSLHKAKGQEFDVVLMPALTQKQFPHDPAQVRLDESDRLILALEALQSPNLDEAERIANRKRMQIEEEARLLYVGLTRARRALFLSTHQAVVQPNGKLATRTPAYCFEQLAHTIRSRFQADTPPATALNIDTSEREP